MQAFIIQKLIKLNTAMTDLTSKVNDIISKLNDISGADEDEDLELPDGIVLPLQSPDDVTTLEVALQEHNVRHKLVSSHANCTVAVVTGLLQLNFFG